MRMLFSVPDDLMVKKETGMVVSSGVVELKKKKQLRLLVIEFNCSVLEEDRERESSWLVHDGFGDDGKWKVEMEMRGGIKGSRQRC